MISYGVQIEPQFGYDFDSIFAICRAAEQSGFDRAWFSDHFMMTTNSTELISHECFATMMAAASQTTKLRLGSLVYCNSYRYPSVLAKQMASLDHFSKGRLDFGLGAGWKQIEYDAYGIPFPSAGVRIQQLSEALDVIKSLWTLDRTNYEGNHYQLKDAISFPKPLQHPYPPIWVGTMEAKPKMLSLAAEKADGINIAWSFAPEVYQEKLHRIEEYCDKYDRDPETLMKSYGVWTRIYEDEEEKLQVWKDIADKRNIKLESIEERYQGSLHGTIEEIKEKLTAYIKLGITHFILMFPKGMEIESMKVFQEKIIGKL